MTKLGDRRPKTSINFTKYAWAGSIRSFRTRIPDSSPHRFYIAATDGADALQPAGLAFDYAKASHYVDLKPGGTANVIFSFKGPPAPAVDKLMELEKKLTSQIASAKRRASEVDLRFDAVETSVKDHSKGLKSLSAAVWPGNSSDLIYHWTKGDRGSVVASGKENKAKIDKQGVMHLSGGSYQPVGSDVDAMLLDACKRSGELSIEVTLMTNEKDQTGPVRIVSFSKDANQRNFTLGQEGENLILRIRTGQNDVNGTNRQVTVTKITFGKPMHVVVSYRSGQLQCHVNGKSMLTKTDDLKGDFRDWKAMTLILGDEVNGDRDWQGSIERLAIRSRFLDSEEASRQFELTQ